MLSRTFRLLLVACLATSSAWAANDPFVGKWKVNPSKSKLYDEMKVEVAGTNKYAITFAPGFGTLDQHMQDLNKARQAADELSRQGAPTFGQRLDAAIQSLQTTRSTFQQMYMSTAATQAQIAQIQQRTSDAVRQIYRDMADDSIRTRNQSHQEYMDRQYGNCFICHTYIGIPGGGYCWRHVPRR